MLSKLTQWATDAHSPVRFLRYHAVVERNIEESGSAPEADRRFYARSYAQPGAMRAGFEVFRAFEQDAKDFAEFAQTKLTMPMLVLTGEKASGSFLIDQARLVDSNVEGVVVKGSGHWLMEEAPQQVIPQLVAFINKSQ